MIDPDLTEMYMEKLKETSQVALKDVNGLPQTTPKKRGKAKTKRSRRLKPNL